VRPRYRHPEARERSEFPQCNTVHVCRPAKPWVWPGGADALTRSNGQGQTTPSLSLCRRLARGGRTRGSVPLSHPSGTTLAPISSAVRPSLRLDAWLNLPVTLLGRYRGVNRRRGLLLGTLLLPVCGGSFVWGNFSRRFGRCGRRRALRLGPRLFRDDA
jgi:hypothetical protein